MMTMPEFGGKRFISIRTLGTRVATEPLVPKAMSLLVL
jgi:hypothetical protein